WSTVHVLVVSCSVVAVCVMTYSDVPSGIGSQAGETVSVSVVLDTTVRVWPAPVPALITTGRPAHWFAVHALVLSASAVPDAVMMYLDVPSGVVIHAGDTVSVFVVLEDTVRVWPAPVPAVILTTSPAHWLAVHALGPVLVVSWSVVLVCPMTYNQWAGLACPGSGRDRDEASRPEVARPHFGRVLERGARLRDD